MTKRHGVVLNATNQPLLSVGIWQIFDPWTNPNLLVQRGINGHPITRPLKIEFHFRRVVHRFAISLANFNRQVLNWNQFLDEGGLESANPELVFDIPEEGGIAADSVFHYLNLFIDDLARAIPYVLAELGTDPTEPEGFGEFKAKLAKNEYAAPTALMDLFAKLNCEDSWWFNSFKRGTGFRQRLTHYTDLVYFHGSAKQGNNNIAGDISLISVGGPVHAIEFENALRDLFSKLCAWLDQLDQLLLQLLSEKLARKGVSWNPFNDRCRCLALPPQKNVRLDVPHYLYLPVLNIA